MSQVEERRIDAKCTGKTGMLSVKWEGSEVIRDGLREDNLEIVGSFDEVVLILKTLEALTTNFDGTSILQSCPPSVKFIH
jgi:hypothetical protein